MPTEPPTELRTDGPASERAAADEKTPQQRPLSPAAERALAEAAARRAERQRLSAMRPKETNGPAGLEPTRYGDWAINGIASDF